MNRYTQEEWQEAARKVNIEFINYVENYKTRTLARCLICSYEWKYMPNKIHQGHKCPKCANQEDDKYSIEKINDIIKSRNIICLSKKYVNANYSMEWKCLICKYEWKNRWNSIRRGGGCPKCAKKASPSQEEWNERARMSHIKFKEQIRNVKTKTEVTCLICGYGSQGEWKILPSNVKKGNGCPRCKYRNEMICHKFMEAIFNEKFEMHKRFSWLKNSRGNQMHLDGYNEKLKIAFEYNGEYHYLKNSRFYKKIIEVDDALKIELCNIYGIILIVIPYWIESHNKEKFIINQYYEKSGIKIPFQKIIWDIFPGYNEEKLYEIHEIAKNINYKIISKFYLGSTEKLEFECNHEHHFWMSPNDFKRGHRCSICFMLHRGALISRGKKNNRNKT